MMNVRSESNKIIETLYPVLLSNTDTTKEFWQTMDAENCIVITGNMKGVDPKYINNFITIDELIKGNSQKLYGRKNPSFFMDHYAMKKLFSHTIDNNIDLHEIIAKQNEIINILKSRNNKDADIFGIQPEFIG